MRALLTSGPGKMELVSHPDPEPSQPDDVLLRIERVGLCGSDLHLFSGDLGAAGTLYPRIQGHEVSAVVESVSDAGGTGLAEGQRVAVLPIFACGECYPCRTQRPNVCARLAILGVHRDGALAERMVVPARNVVAVAPGVPPEAAALIEPTSVAVRAVRRGRVAAGEHVAVFGAGPMGQAVCLAAAAVGATVMVVDPLRERCAAALRTGAAAVSSAASPGAADDIRAWCGKEALEVVIDTTGNPAAFGGALETVANGGRIVVVGLTELPVSFPYGLLAHRELDVLGVSCCDPADFGRAAELVAGHLDEVMPLISHRIGLDQVIATLPLVGTPGTMKITVDVGMPSNGEQITNE